MRIVPILVTMSLAHAAPLAAQQLSADDQEWLAECRERDLERDNDDSARFCEVLVEAVDGPSASITIMPVHNGGVDIRGWDQDRLEVHALVQAHAETESEARELVRSVRIELEPGTARAIGPEDDDDWSVGWRVFVPRRRDITARATNGPVSVEGVEGTLRLATQNGPIELSNVGGDVEARAVNGPLVVALTGSTWQGTGLDAETVNGPVELKFPNGYSATLELGTVTGPLMSNVPLTIEPGQDVTKRFRVRLGSGGPPIRVVTTHGPVTIESP